MVLVLYIIEIILNIYYMYITFVLYIYRMFNSYHLRCIPDTKRDNIHKS